MDQPNEQFEKVRLEYLRQAYPGDLADILDSVQDQSEIDGKDGVQKPTIAPPSELNLVSNSYRDKLMPVLFSVAALVLVAITIGIANWLGDGSAKPKVAKSDPLSTAKKVSRANRLFSISKPISLKFSQSANSKLKLLATKPFDSSKDRIRKTKASTLAAKRPRIRKANLWNSRNTQLAQKQPDSTPIIQNDPKNPSKSTTPRSRIKFRSRFQFEPIPSYRRS